MGTYVYATCLRKRSIVSCFARSSHLRAIFAHKRASHSSSSRKGRGCGGGGPCGPHCWPSPGLTKEGPAQRGVRPCKPEFS
eukprot:1167870-Karenia_brevis.AAC.1